MLVGCGYKLGNWASTRFILFFLKNVYPNGRWPFRGPSVEGKKKRAGIAGDSAQIVASICPLPETSRVRVRSGHWRCRARQNAQTAPANEALASTQFALHAPAAPHPAAPSRVSCVRWHATRRRAPPPAPFISSLRICYYRLRHQ